MKKSQSILIPLFMFLAVFLFLFGLLLDLLGEKTILVVKEYSENLTETDTELVVLLNYDKCGGIKTLPIKELIGLSVVKKSSEINLDYDNSYKEVNLEECISQILGRFNAETLKEYRLMVMLDKTVFLDVNYPTNVEIKDGEKYLTVVKNIPVPNKNYDLVNAYLSAKIPCKGEEC